MNSHLKCLILSMQIFKHLKSGWSFIWALVPRIHIPKWTSLKPSYWWTSSGCEAVCFFYGDVEDAGVQIKPVYCTPLCFPCPQRPHMGWGDSYSSPPKWDSILQGRGVTQSLPRQWGSPSADNSRRWGEQPQQAPGQTTVNQSTSPLFPLLVATTPPLYLSLFIPSRLLSFTVCTLYKALVQISSLEILAVNIMSMMFRQVDWSGHRWTQTSITYV